MFTVIRKRLLLAIPTLLLVSFVTFFLGYLAPGSPVSVMMGQHGDIETQRRLEKAYGLDQPPLVQYGRYLAGLPQGNFGVSFAQNEKPVSEIIAEKFPVTAHLACLSLLLALAIGLPAGTIAALRHNGLVDRGAMGTVLLLVSMPPFVLAPLLMIVFSLWLSWLPTSGWINYENFRWEDLAKVILPVAVLAARPAALLARFMRSSMLEVVRQDYVRTAYAKGLSPGKVLRKHILKNAFLPVLTVIGNTFGFMLTGSFVIETIFTVPGIGYESIQSIMSRDYPVVQGVALLVAVIFISVNLLVDVLYGVIDPRVRYEEAR